MQLCDLIRTNNSYSVASESDSKCFLSIGQRYERAYCVDILTTNFWPRTSPRCKRSRPSTTASHHCHEAISTSANGWSLINPSRASFCILLAHIIPILCNYELAFREYIVSGPRFTLTSSTSKHITSFTFMTCRMHHSSGHCYKNLQRPPVRAMAWKQMMFDSASVIQSSANQLRLPCVSARI